jgi:hypothetical protein
MSGRALILSICLALVLPISAWAEASSGLEPDWPELWSSLDEIGAAFQSVTASSDAESERLSQERLELQKERDASALEKSELTSERQSLSEERKRLDAEKQASKELEDLYAGIGQDLAKANKKLKRGWIWLLIAALIGAVADRVADHLLD